MALTTKQWQLYNLIKTNSMLGKKTTQLEICTNIEGYEYKDRNGTTDKCSAIWTDIKEINLSSDTDKIIITKRYTYWIGNEEETNEYLSSCWESLVPALDRYWKLVKKAKKNGQYKLLSNKGVLITEDSKAREYVESFIEVEPPKKTLEDMTIDELRVVYKDLCWELSFPPVKYYQKEIYIQEIKYMEEVKAKRENQSKEEQV